ncbi:MAG: hypothetical protein RIC35_21615 [Marinoscillum sp.]
MERRDILKDEIEQLGKVLGKILATFLGLKAKGQVAEGIEVSNEQFKTQLDLDMEKILKMSREDLGEYIHQWNLTSEHLEMLSSFLLESGRDGIENCNDEAKVRLAKALDLLEIADVVSKTVSLEREGKKTEIQQLLENCVS